MNTYSVISKMKEILQKRELRALEEAEKEEILEISMSLDLDFSNSKNIDKLNIYETKKELGRTTSCFILSKRLEMDTHAIENTTLLFE